MKLVVGFFRLGGVGGEGIIIRSCVEGIDSGFVVDVVFELFSVLGLMFIIKNRVGFFYF